MDGWRIGFGKKIPRLVGFGTGIVGVVKRWWTDIEGGGWNMDAIESTVDSDGDSIDAI